MKQKKTIKIDREVIKTLFIGLLLGWATVFIIEHFSEVSYVADTSELIEKERKRRLIEEKEYKAAIRKQNNGQYLTLDEDVAIARYRRNQNEGFEFNYDIPNSTPVSTIFLDTPFDSKLRISGRGYAVSDVGSSYGSFNDYSNKIKYYIKAVFEDAKYVLYFGFGYFTLIVVFRNLRVRFE
ncbi:hypothetical protein [Flagellimonas myxillae]|uniref:hypothetical protein n=1 Tax=Flagellimonas myxillae TaxID=2942214 RepID=UPI00201F01EA|nr:hypothetical protein [Muricauda myxillae]MCL6264933.1 hypothetical protein [Muricauda myxillae]